MSNLARRLAVPLTLVASTIPLALAGCRSHEVAESARPSGASNAAAENLSKEDFDDSMRWVYKLHLQDVPPTEMPTVARETLSIVRQRLEQHGVEKYRLRLEGDDRLVFEMPQLAAETGAAVTQLIGRRGRLVFRAESGEELEPSDLLRVERITDPNGAPALQLDFGPDGASHLEDLTGRNIGKKLAIVVDGEVLSSPTIMGRIGASVQISGSFSEEEIARLATLLRGGELPAELELYEVDTVSPGDR